MDDDLLLRVANSVFISGTHVLGCTTSVARIDSYVLGRWYKTRSSSVEARSMILYKRVSRQIIVSTL